MAEIYVFGNNLHGQAGIASGQEFIQLPTSISGPNIDPANVSRIILTQKQTYVISNDGGMLSCGCNENNELGRQGKKSLFQRVDALETFVLCEVAAGDGFVLAESRAGQLISWGCNSHGELGSSNREAKEKPRPLTSPLESMIQLSAGSHHVQALSKTGNVYTWGANRKGQLGDGQLTSSCVPKFIPQLKHRPIIAITCGETHCLAVTIGGNVFSWGENCHGQLGLGDTTPRLRPELVRALKSARVQRISAGQHHSMAVGANGLLFAFGSNSHGQCGLSVDTRIQSSPCVVERLRELLAVQISCGAAHSLVLCAAGEYCRTPRVFAMGLNSSGQLGLGHSGEVHVPTAVSLPEGVVPVGVASGPLAMHSFIVTGAVAMSRPELPAIQQSVIQAQVSKLQSLVSTGASFSLESEIRRSEAAINNALRTLRESVASGFSSISVLNASFHMSSASVTTIASGLSIDLQTVRRVYEMIFATEQEQVIATLGRATLQLADQLKECPVDDPENLSVFLIVLENPLMLRPQHFHVAIERVIRGVLSLPKSYRIILFGWLRSYPSEYFSRILQVLQSYLSFALSNRRAALDCTSAVLVLHSLYECNREARIVPASYFYNSQVLLCVDLRTEWQKFKVADPDSHVFNMFSYPFLIDVTAKHELLIQDFKQIRQLQAQKHVRKYVKFTPNTSIEGNQQVVQLTNELPSHVVLLLGEDNTPNVALSLPVTRDQLLIDLFVKLQAIVLENPKSLFLPIKAAFEGEGAVDQGGVTKELLSLAIQQLITETQVVQPCSNQSFVWFSTRVTGTSNKYKAMEALFSASSNHFIGSKSPCSSGAGASASASFGCSDSDSGSPVGKVPRLGLNVLRTGGSEQTAVTTVSAEDMAVQCAYYLGLLVGLAAYHGVLTDLPLPSCTYKIITNNTLTLEDLFEVDTSLARSLQWLLDYEGGPIEDMFGTAFTASGNPLLDNAPSYTLRDPAARTKHVELKNGGSDVLVTRSNRAEFVHLFVQHALYESCRLQVDAYLQGVRTLFHGKIIDLCTYAEVESLLCGSREIGDLSELRLRTIYKGEFHDEHPVIQWFWNVLSDLSGPQKRKLLHFVTGSDRVPVGGLSKLALVIQSTQQPASSLPSSHTCFNILNLTIHYDSKEQVAEKLNHALEYHEGFGFA